MRTLALCAGLLIATVTTALGAEPPRHSIQIVIDNSAALQGVEIAEGLKRQLLFHVTELRKRSEWKFARVHIVSTNNPRNLYVGSPVDLFRNGSPVLSQIATVKNGCSDLLGAFDQVRLNLELEKPQTALVLVFSSLIHTGAPCDRVSITLPQPVPEKLDLAFLKSDGMRLRFFFVHHLQMRPWADFIKKSEVSNATIHDEETTRAILHKGLEP